MNYLRSLGATKEPSITDIREVLDVLTVPELRQISNSVLSKKGISCTRKKELVDRLFMSYEDGKCPSLPNTILEQYGTFIRISSTAEFLCWRLEAIEVAQVMDESLDENNLATAMRCIEVSDEHMSSTENASQLSIPESVVSFHLRFTASWVYSKVLTLGVSFFERHHSWLVDVLAYGGIWQTMLSYFSMKLE
ncbi:hypothetical protein ACLOJK_008377 [Asimina triloba]